jgi:hypothetical protein
MRLFALVCGGRYSDLAWNERRMTASSPEEQFKRLIGTRHEQSNFPESPRRRPTI